MILVTGATGNVGHPLVDSLLRAGADVRAVTRNPRTADMPVGVDVVTGDPSRPDTIAPHLDGVTALYLNPAAVGDAADKLLGLAQESGVARVVLLSALVVADAAGPEDALAAHHKAIEDELTWCGLEWVILRPGMFASNALRQWGGQLRAGDVVRGPYADAPEAPIDPRDIAEVSAHALLSDELVGQRPHLTGPESLTFAEMVAIIGGATGRPLRFQEIPVEAARERMLQHGFPAPFLDAMLTRQAATVGKPALVTDEVERILGHPARSFAQWVRDHAALFPAPGS